MNKHIIKEDDARLLARLGGMEKLAGKTVLVAGAGSLIGGDVARCLLEAERRYGLGLRVVCLVRTMARAELRFADYLSDPGFLLLQADLGDRLTYDGPADIILHAGGSSSPSAYANDPAGILRANVVGVLNLLELARRRGTEAFLFLSSREVYGHPGETAAITEDDLGRMNHLIPRNIYPESKKLTESAMVAYGTQYGVPWLIFRIASVYGPGMKLKDDGRAISDFVRAAVEGQDIRLNSDGSAVRSYCYITDCVAGILTALLSGSMNQVYNLANEGQQYSIRETAEMALAAGGGKGSLRFAEQESRGGGGNIAPAVSRESGAAKAAPQYSAFAYVPMEMSRMAALGWQPEVGLTEGLERTIAYFRG